MSDLPDFVRQKSKTNPNFYEVSVPKGYVLFTEGDDARHLYVVTSGSLEIFDDVTKQRIAVISKGSAFGDIMTEQVRWRLVTPSGTPEECKEHLLKIFQDYL